MTTTPRERPTCSQLWNAFWITVWIAFITLLILLIVETLILVFTGTPLTGGVLVEWLLGVFFGILARVAWSDADKKAADKKAKEADQESGTSKEAIGWLFVGWFTLAALCAIGFHLMVTLGALTLMCLVAAVAGVILARLVRRAVKRILHPPPPPPSPPVQEEEYWEPPMQEY